VCKPLAAMGKRPSGEHVLGEYTPMACFSTGQSTGETTPKPGEMTQPTCLGFLNR
jgi:hypothetical protein